MSHASEFVTLPEVPAKIRERFVSTRDIDIAEHLSSLEHVRPGLFDTMLRMIDVLESGPGIEKTTVDYYEEDTLKPVTIWARSTFSPEEEEENLLRIHDISEEVLRGFTDLVLVAVV